MTDKAEGLRSAMAAEQRLRIQQENDTLVVCPVGNLPEEVRFHAAHHGGRGVFYRVFGNRLNRRNTVNG